MTLQELKSYIESNPIIASALGNLAQNYSLIIGLIQREFKLSDEFALVYLNKLGGTCKALGPKIMQAMLNSGSEKDKSLVFNYIFEAYPDTALDAEKMVEQLVTNAEAAVAHEKEQLRASLSTIVEQKVATEIPVEAPAVVWAKQENETAQKITFLLSAVAAELNKNKEKEADYTVASLRTRCFFDMPVMDYKLAVTMVCATLNINIHLKKFSADCNTYKNFVAQGGNEFEAVQDNDPILLDPQTIHLTNQTSVVKTHKRPKQPKQPKQISFDLNLSDLMSSTNTSANDIHPNSTDNNQSNNNNIATKLALKKQASVVETLVIDFENFRKKLKSYSDYRDNNSNNNSNNNDNFRGVSVFNSSTIKTMSAKYSALQPTINKEAQGLFEAVAQMVNADATALRETYLNSICIEKLQQNPAINDLSLTEQDRADNLAKDYKILTFLCAELKLNIHVTENPGKPDEEHTVYTSEGKIKTFVNPKSDLIKGITIHLVKAGQKFSADSAFMPNKSETQNSTQMKLQ